MGLKEGYISIVPTQFDLNCSPQHSTIEHMEFIKDKYFFWGILTGLLWTSFGVILLVFFLSDASLEDSIFYLYKQKRLGGLISIAALINLPLFFIALRKNKVPFAAGIVAISILTVLFIAVLKIN